MLATETPAEARRYRALQRGRGLHVARCQCRAGRHERPLDEQHSAFSITLVERGVFSYHTASGRSVLGPGWLMLGNDSDGYTCSHEESDGQGDDCVMLGLSAAALDDASSALGRTPTRRAFGRASLPPLPRVAALLGALAADGDEGFALEETALAVVNAVQCALHDGAAPAPVARQDGRALAAARFIEAHAEESLALDDVATAVGVRPFHLLRLFRRAVGVTPHQYLMRVRLQRAVALLRDSTLPVTTVAYETGWSDLSNFIRTFRRDVGCSPGALRRGATSLLHAA